MTDRDVLKRASEALRKSGEPSAEELARLRERVLERRGPSNVTPLGAKRVTRNARWLLPLAAAFMAASALAATPGAWEGMLEAAERFLHIQQLAPGQKSAPKPRSKKPARPSAPETLAQPAAPAEVPSRDVNVQPSVSQPNVDRASHRPAPSEASQPRPRASRERAASEQPARPAPAASEPAAQPAPPSGPSEDLRLYRHAHELHFRARDFGQALLAWDAYLQRLPDGTFAVEARYNRALCFVRLGRYAEARLSLVEFAEGKRFAGYRQEEATRLIEALDKRR